MELSFSVTFLRAMSRLLSDSISAVSREISSVVSVGGVFCAAVRSLEVNGVKIKAKATNAIPSEAVVISQVSVNLAV